MTTDNASENADATCVHHWKIGSPKGLTSVGVCQECGAEREFSNNEATVQWSRSLAIGVAHRASRRRRSA